MFRFDLRIPVILLLAGLSACTSAPRYPPVPVEDTATKDSPVADTPIEDTAETISGNDVVRVAKTWIGVPYRYGRCDRNGIDCSCLVKRVYGELGREMPRMTSEQAKVGTRIERAQLKTGDLVFFSSKSGGTTISHVGIYAGRGEIIHASTRSRQVRFDRLDNRYFKKRFVSARRVL